MNKPVGKYLPLSPFRRLVTDLMHFSRQVPSVTADRRMDLAAVVAARQCCSPRPTWSAIFAKAFGLVARDYPELRRAYMKCPWPHLYEHPHNVVVLNVDRELPGERIVLYCLIRGPEKRSLTEIDALIRHHKETPVEQLRSYKRAVAIGKVPWPFRRWFWWLALNVAGRRRCHNYGTFGLSSIASQGAGLLKLIPVLTSTLHYGLFDKNSCLDMRLSWDHRVLDGATIANILVDMETVLGRDIVAELRTMQVAKAA